VDTRALDRPLDYAVPAALAGRVVPGAVVACPLGPRRVVGVVVGVAPATHDGRVVPLAGVVDVPPIPPALVDLALWIARRHAAPAAACLRLVAPPGAEGALRRSADGSWRLATPPTGRARRLVAELVPGAGPASGRRAEVLGHLARAGGALPLADLVRAAGTTSATVRRLADAGLVRIAEVAPGDDGAHALPAAVAPAVPPPPTPAQAAAVERIAAAGPGEALLLFGVTGSGKTEVYLRAIAHARARGRGTIVLAPEISLTPQLLARLRARLGPGVALWHSGMSAGERAESYARVREGRADVVVGARSAVFAPVPDLGLVIVDEEHDGSYKQDATPHYDARQLAYRRARAEGAVAVYGSATPRPETWHALPRVELPARADGSPPPRVEVVDMRTQPPGPVSRPLARALRDALDAGGKAVLLLNRRGFALRALCGACGHTASCPRCDVALVQHEEPRRLACHHCGHEEPVPTVCARCGAAQVMRGGVGTQGLEAALGRIVPRARLVRLDASTTARRGAVAGLLADFARPGPAVLLGTQMVAKGHDLPDVTVAAVLDADAGLRQADFRAEERTLALIVQAAGRAGRRGERARVIVQAWEPGARVIVQATALDVAGFLEGELVRRRAHGMPPFGHLVRVVVEGDDRGTVLARARRLAADAQREEVTVLGPAPMHRLRGRWRRSVLVRADRAADARDAVRWAVARGDADGVRVVVDVDPQSL